MTIQKAQDILSYIMHPHVELAYGRTHDWFDANPGMKQYQEWDWSCAQQALARGTPVAAAFNFNLFFPTHFFKTCHALQSDSIIGFSKLAAWLHYNPYITIIDVGCGDGAGSIAAVETILRLREKGQIDPRPVQLCCIGLDPNPNGLSIYEKMMEEVAKIVAGCGVEVTYQVCPYVVSQSSGYVESHLFDLRRRWNQPSLGHSIVIEANLNDLLEGEYRRDQQRFMNLRTYSQEPFGQQLASFYRQLFEGIPIDHLHILSIDTEPARIQRVVKEMLSSIEARFSERGHALECSDIYLENIEIKNPTKSFWRKKGYDIHPLNPFVVSVCHIHNRELELDGRWQKITSQENLELAWARARQEMLREIFSDEVEIRLFEQNLESNLERLHFELECYAIHAGYIPQTFRYAAPKDSGNDRPKGLTWLEEEILMIAIIQVVGANALQQKPWSYAYRLSPENSPERGATEYLYEWWADAWDTFRQEVGEYAQRFREGVVIQTDIQAYFTRILQDQLQKLAKDELGISKRIEWLMGLLISKDLVGHDPGRGLVQGSVGSGFLANLYLTPLDNLFSVIDSKGRRLFRYVDDIVVVVPDAADEKTTQGLLFSTISNELKLEPNPRKTGRYSVEQFLPIIAPDVKLDQLRRRYEEFVDPLWWMNEDLRLRFRESSGNRAAWWLDITRYRACLTELGFYITEAWLSRQLSRTICSDQVPSTNFHFPDLPFMSSITEAREWAREFRGANSVWGRDFNALKSCLSDLFFENLEIITGPSEGMDRHQFDIASRHLRFAANRLGVLGLDSIHPDLTNLLCKTPWLVRGHQRLIEDLARQAYSGDIWKLLDFHQGSSREMSVYMSATTLRAVRFLPRLEIEEWQKLIEFMFVGDEITRLMATETWLVITSQLEGVPLADKIRARTSSLFSANSSPARRLLKNYLLVLGMIDPEEVAALSAKFVADPLVSEACAAVLKGLTVTLFRDNEPDILRRKYYSTKYRDFDDGSGGSI